MDKKTWRTKSSMAMSLPWILFTFGGERIMAPPNLLYLSVSERSIMPRIRVTGGKKFAAPSWSHATIQGTCDPLCKKRDPVPLQDIL